MNHDYCHVQEKFHLCSFLIAIQLHPLSTDPSTNQSLIEKHLMLFIALLMSSIKRFVKRLNKNLEIQLKIEKFNLFLIDKK